jgi:hypothetical protein
MKHESPPLTEADLARHAEHLAMIAGTAAAMLAVPAVELSGPHMEPDGTGGWLVKDGPYGARLDALRRTLKYPESPMPTTEFQRDAIARGEMEARLAELGKIAMSLHGAIRDANEACFRNRDVDQVKRILENAVNLGWRIRAILDAPTEAGREGA